MEEIFLGAERLDQLGGDAPKGDFYSSASKVLLFYLRFRKDLLAFDAFFYFYLKLFILETHVVHKNFGLFFWAPAKTLLTQ